MSTTKIDMLYLRTDSSQEIPFCIGDVPAGASVTKAWFMIKASLADADADALVSKEIDLGAGSMGQILDDGGTDQEANLVFVLDDDDANVLVVGKTYMSAVKVLLSSGLSYQPPYTRRPCKCLSAGIERVS